MEVDSETGKTSTTNNAGEQGSCISRFINSKEFWIRLVAGILSLVIFQPIITSANNKDSIPDWQLLFWFGFVLILTAQISQLPIEFFTGYGVGLISLCKYYFCGIPYDDELDVQKSNMDTTRQVGFWTLMPSAFITWIFAKSIQNASTLAASYGILGSIAYSGWYLSFFSASIVIYFLRTRHNSSSLPGTIQHIYGPIAQLLFCLGLLYRLNNEVWSNSLVVGGFYGDVHSKSFWIAVIFSTLIPAIYVFMGGMRSSLISDVIQAVLAFLFLFIILGIISGSNNFSINYKPDDGWNKGGWELLFTAIIQGLISYPFHDPVLTDRCYLSTPKIMLKSFIVGGFISMIFIILFGIIGIYGKQAAGSGLPPAIGNSLGPVAYTLINFVFMTSSMSTLDSTFTSSAKIFSLDIGGWFGVLNDDNREDHVGPLKLGDIKYINKKHVLVGRIAIIFMAIVGTLPLIVETKALNATLVSGTTVMGLGPPIYLMLFWKYKNDTNESIIFPNGWRQSPLAFIFPFITGVVYGSLYQANSQKAIDWTEKLTWGAKWGVGPYTTILGTNVLGHICCFIACLLGFVLDQFVLKFGDYIDKETLTTSGKDTDTPNDVERVTSNDPDVNEALKQPTNDGETEMQVTI